MPASPVISRMVGVVVVGMREEEDGDIESSENPHDSAASKKDIPVVELLDQGSDSVTAGCQCWSCGGGGCRDRSQRSYKVSVVVVVVAAAVVGCGKSLMIANSFLNQQYCYLVTLLESITSATH